MSAFKVLHTVLQIFYLLDIVVLPHFSYLKNMLPNNLNKICVHILTFFFGFLHFCVINIIQSHFRWNIIRFYFRRKEIKKTLNPSRIFDIIFWSAFLTSLYFKHSFANNPFLEQLGSLANFTFFRMLSPVVEWCCAYSTLPFDGSRDDRITLVADFFRVYLWIVTRYVYS